MTKNFIKAKYCLKWRSFESLLSHQYPKIYILKIKIWDGHKVSPGNYHLVAGEHVAFKHLTWYSEICVLK